MSSALAAPKASDAFTVTPDQQVVIDALMMFLADPDPEHLFFVLSGFAGTGKTFCMKEVVAILSRSRMKFAFTAPTNKAAKVLREIVGEASTIYSLLGLRVDKSGELKTLLSTKETSKFEEFDAVFVDEGSMVNKQLLTLLKNKSFEHNVKVIFMGDSAQLPPVNEAESGIWNVEAYRSALTKVMRHDNQILTLVTAIRNVIPNAISPSIKIVSDNDGSQGVWKLTVPDFKRSMYVRAEAGDFADGIACKVIAWRNVRVQEYNTIIRKAIFKEDAVEGYYLAGERIVAAAPCFRSDDTMLLATDDEALVLRVQEGKHPREPKYRSLELLCSTESGATIRLLAIHPESRQQFENDSQMLAHEAKANGKLWKRFWKHKELFHDIKYAYAITTHRAQGSTYENVWVDYQDILMNRNRKEAFQCLYVACSRPTTCLYLA